MIQGMSERILIRVKQAKESKNYKHVLYRNSAMVCSIILHVKTGEVFMTVWTFKPLTIIDYLDINDIMKQFAKKTTTKHVMYSHANLEFA